MAPDQVVNGFSLSASYRTANPSARLNAVRACFA